MELKFVSVVIPTIGRSSLLNSIESALGQEDVLVEVLACQGSNEFSAESLGKFLVDKRVKIIGLTGVSVPNANVARQNGVTNSTGEYIAFLDDDDTWDKQKLIKQIRALESQPQNSVCSSKSKIHLNGKRDVIWPLISPKQNANIADYLFVRKSFKNNHPMVQTSTLLAKRAVFEFVEFDPSLIVHQDLDWLIRAQSAGVNFVFLDEPLSNYSAGSKDSANNRTKAINSLEWIQKIETYISRQAYAEFLAGTVSSRALQEKSLIFSLRALMLGVRTGELGAKGLAVSIARILFWVFGAPIQIVRNLEPSIRRARS